MSTLSGKYGAAQFPSVNLVPKEFAERRAMRAVQSMAAVALLAAVGVMVVWFLGALAAQNLAKKDYNNAIDEETAAVAARDAKMPVWEQYKAYEVGAIGLAQIGYAEMNYDQILAAVLGADAEDTSFDSLHIVGSSAAVVVTGFGDAAYPDGIATVTFKARATSLASATALLDRLEQLPGIYGVHGTTEQYLNDAEMVYYSVEGQAQISREYLTERLLPDSDVFDVDIDEIRVTPEEAAAPPPAAPSPSPTPSAQG